MQFAEIYWFFFSRPFANVLVYSIREWPIRRIDRKLSLPNDMNTQKCTKMVWKYKNWLLFFRNSWNSTHKKFKNQKPFYIRWAFASAKSIIRWHTSSTFEMALFAHNPHQYPIHTCTRTQIMMSKKFEILVQLEECSNSHTQKKAVKIRARNK